MTPVEILRAARKLIENPANWSKRHGFGDRWHYCADGACRAAANGPDRAVIMPPVGSGYVPARNYLWEASGAENIWVWNDAAERTHPEILAAFDKAIALAEQRAAT